MLHSRILIDPETDHRREHRLGVSADISLRQLGQTAVEARLVNVSSRGFMAEAEALIIPGSRIWLTLPGVGRVNGLVLWARSGRVGGEFAQAVDPLVVINAAARPSNSI